MAAVAAASARYHRHARQARRQIQLRVVAAREIAYIQANALA
jgi:hypothetical protein